MGRRASAVRRSGQRREVSRSSNAMRSHDSGWKGSGEALRPRSRHVPLGRYSGSQRACGGCEGSRASGGPGSTRFHAALKVYTPKLKSERAIGYFLERYTGRPSEPRDRTVASVPQGKGWVWVGGRAGYSANKKSPTNMSCPPRYRQLFNSLLTAKAARRAEHADEHAAGDGGRRLRGPRRRVGRRGDDDDEGSSRRSWTRLGWTCHRCRHFSIYL